jgi:hypothetical protein
MGVDVWFRQRRLGSGGLLMVQEKMLALNIFGGVALPVF